MRPLQLLPAVDVSDGRAVRLIQGQIGSAQAFGDPVQAALQWQAAGAQWVHLVDLDAAFGRGSNHGILRDVVSSLDIEVEVAGGIRDDDSLRQALETGCRRAILSTSALAAPQWCAATIAKHGDRIAVGLDVRGTTLAARGGTRDGGELYDAVARLDAAGCARYVVTDVRKDGMLTGPNLKLLSDVCSRSDAQVIASGGVTTLADVEALAALVPVGVEAAIVGTALHSGALNLRAALTLTAELATRAEG